MKATYTGPEKSGIKLDITIGKNPVADVFPIDIGIVRRLSGSRAVVIPWCDVIHALDRVLFDTPEMRADLRIMLDKIERDR